MRSGVVVAVACAIASPATTLAQRINRTCGPDTAYASALQEEVVGIVTGADHESAEARHGKIPRLDTADVRLVRDEAICAKALEAYSAHDTSGISVTQVYVVRAGNFYFVADPDTDSGDGVDLEVFDAAFAYVMTVDD